MCSCSSSLVAISAFSASPILEVTRWRTGEAAAVSSSFLFEGLFIWGFMSACISKSRVGICFLFMVLFYFLCMAMHCVFLVVLVVVSVVSSSAYPCAEPK